MRLRKNENLVVVYRKITSHLCTTVTEAKALVKKLNKNDDVEDLEVFEVYHDSDIEDDPMDGSTNAWYDVNWGRHEMDG